VTKARSGVHRGEAYAGLNTVRSITGRGELCSGEVKCHKWGLERGE